MWHNRFSEKENEAVEAHIPRHRNSKTKKPRHRETETIIPRHRGSKTKKPRHRDSKIKKPRHRETETNKPQHRDSKAFFQRTKSHDIEIPRPKSHDIEFLWNSDPYAPWYLALLRRSAGVPFSVVPCSGVPGFIVCPNMAEYNFQTFKQTNLWCNSHRICLSISSK